MAEDGSGFGTETVAENGSGYVGYMLDMWIFIVDSYDLQERTPTSGFAAYGVDVSSHL